jgi:hypothetical protein
VFCGYNCVHVSPSILIGDYDGIEDPGGKKQSHDKKSQNPATESHKKDQEDWEKSKSDESRTDSKGD